MAIVWLTVASFFLASFVFWLLRISPARRAEMLLVSLWLFLFMAAVAMVVRYLPDS
jgi:hypothetical protein